MDGAPAALAYGGGSLWVADSDSRRVAQVDPGANKVAHRYDVGNVPRSLAFAGGVVWVASGVDGRIRGIDLERGGVTQSIPVGANPSAIAAGAGALWVASEEAGTVTRIDPRTRSVLPPITVGNGPSAIAYGEGAVWVVNRHDGTLSRINPDRTRCRGPSRWERTRRRSRSGRARCGWRGEDGTVARVDPDGPRKAKRFETGSRPAAIAVAGGKVWAAADAPQTSHRGGTLRVRLPYAPKAGIALDPLHPLAYTTIMSAELNSLLYDGLVGYRRVPGAAGHTLVGALATTAPPPVDFGRMYIFTLRRGLRYSDGRPVQVTDFRASMERFLEATRDLPPAEELPPFYDGIVGARACMHSRAPCDLSRGIEVNVPARTIAIHLTRPDGDLLHKLTMQFAYVMPAGSPGRATTGPTPPGTGPYRSGRLGRPSGRDAHAQRPLPVQPGALAA